MRTFVLNAVIVVFTGGSASALAAQTGGTAQSPETLNVFLDCQTWGCDDDYFRTEIVWVNWVRDRQVADVHVLVTAQETGAGGRRFDLAFVGGQRFAGTADTLSTTIGPAATDDEERQELARLLKLGLVRFAADTPVAARLEIGLRAADGSAAAPSDAAAAQADPWNFWVFRLGLNGFLDGESQASFRNVSGDVRATRITEEWKLTLRTRGSAFHSRFELSDSTIETERSSYQGDLLVANSWGAHWSGGALASVSSSTFENHEISARIAPALEYNVFPYDESTRRQLTFRYSVGPRFIEYEEETIFFRTQERFAEQLLEAELEQTQPWGSVNLNLEAGHFLGWQPGAQAPAELSADQQRYSLGLFGNVEVRLFQGLSANIGGSYSKIRDQIGLPRAGASDEEVLLRLQQLETDYRYFMRFGLSYTFGSIYNNIVNPRFSGV
ncbi:MAG: hypothetical protein ACRELD_15515 [Longimicrobiales bacterium]